ncbi:MAG: hypothetical protein LBL52_03125, partial [Rickettsiales bacterium]|nr:hypothetical protein [Rickettsiales bacterium]
MKFIKVMIAASLIVPLASFFLADADWTRRTHAIGTSLGENKYGLYLASVRAEILNDTPALEDFYAQAAEQNGGDFLGRLFILDALAGRENEAADRARQSLAENRGGVIPALYLAVGEFRKQNFAEASKLLGDIKGPDGAPTRSFAVRLFRGWTLMAEGKMDAAISLLDDDADNMAFEKTALVHLAWMAELAGKQDYAAELWGEAAAYWLDASEAKAAVDFYMRRGDRAKALSLMENFRVKAPSSVSFQMLSKKVGEDGYEPDTAPTPSQGFARALFEIANGILSLNRFDTADVYALYLDMALSLEPDMDIALLMRADAYRRSGNMEKFEETAAKIPAS